MRVRAAPGPVRLSNDPVASSIREPVAGVTGEPSLLRAFCVESGCATIVTMTTGTQETHE